MSEEFVTYLIIFGAIALILLLFCLFFVLFLYLESIADRKEASEREIGSIVAFHSLLRDQIKTKAEKSMWEFSKKEYGYQPLDDGKVDKPIPPKGPGVNIV